uniref:Uncharacterized protein n=1 Tax=Megaselia scalaris TaxID=36166 RepID=T1H1B4_MEGSC
MIMRLWAHRILKDGKKFIRLADMVLSTIWNTCCLMVQTWMAITLLVIHRCMYALLTIRKLVLECFYFEVPNGVHLIMPIKLLIRISKHFWEKLS